MIVALMIGVKTSCIPAAEGRLMLNLSGVVTRYLIQLGFDRLKQNVLCCFATAERPAGGSVVDAITPGLKLAT